MYSEILSKTISMFNVALVHLDDINPYRASIYL